MDQPQPPGSTPFYARWQFAAALVAVAAVAAGVLLFVFRDRVSGDLSARDQELCHSVLDDDQPIGFLSGQLDELIKNDGNFSSEGDAYAFSEVPVGRSEAELSSRTPNYDEPDSAAYIDDPELLTSAKALEEALFDLKLAADDGGPVDSATLDGARGAIDDMVDSCTS